LPAGTETAAARGFRKLGSDPLLPISLALGFAFFLFRFGARILDPRNVEWLLARDDTATHYLGWLFFRQESWHWPLGKIAGYLWPAGTSVGLTGSLPVLSIPLKALVFLLPDSFQFTGFWMFLSYGLQGLFAALLTREFTQSRGLRLAAVLLFLLAPSFLQREGHTALASHWILLAALWLYVRKREPYHIGTIVRDWVLLLLICCGLHPYLPLMVLAIALAALVRDFLLDRTLSGRSLAVAVAILPAVVLAAWYLVGYFLFIDDPQLGGNLYANSALNLNALWNPLDTSLILARRPTLAAFENEGYNYLGLGWMVVIAAGLVILAIDRRHSGRTVRHLPLVAVLVGMALFALGNKIAYDDAILVQWAIPTWLQPLFNPFRACARFFWPPFYGLAILSLAMLAGRARLRWVAPFVAACAIVQAVDISPTLNLQPKYRALRFESRLRSPLWRQIATQVDRIVTYPPYLKDTNFVNDFRDIALLAAEHHKSTSAGYVARVAYSEVAATVDAVKRQMFEGGADERAVYILRGSYFAERFIDLQENLTCTEIDGFQVCFAKNAPIHPSRMYTVESTTPAIYLARVLDRTVVLIVKEEATAHLSEEFKQIMRGMGSRIDELSYGGSYLALIHEGALLFEQVQNQNEILLEAERGYQAGPLLLARSLVARSGGAACGDVASLVIDGEQKIFNSRGLNMAILDGNQNVLEVATFDTHVRDEGYVFRLVPNL
jgi:hypothetical protein